MSGRVLLVGAGPGDPDLLTVRAARALAEADLVLYDALVDRRTLALATRAHCFFVGKRAGRHAMAQSTIEKLMVDGARAGRIVVRLKAGDPFMLGRGGEEAAACEAAGVPVEIVPGVSSALAGPAAAGIPVTHRHVSAGVLVLSASPAEHYRRVLAALPPGAVTVVLMMALGARAEITRDLLAFGWPSDLAAAVVVGATTPRQWSWTGSLADLASVVVPDDHADLPGLIVLGPVVSLADVIRRATARSDESRFQEECAWPRMSAP